MFEAGDAWEEDATWDGGGWNEAAAAGEASRKGKRGRMTGEERFPARVPARCGARPACGARAGPRARIPRPTASGADGVSSPLMWQL